jgi:hypothetical protein
VAYPTLGIQQEAVALQQRLDAPRRRGLEAEAAVRCAASDLACLQVNRNAGSSPSA